MATVLSDVALSYLQAGLSILPCRPDKKPALKTWSEYQKHLPTHEEVRSWFSTNGKSLAVIGGAVSGNLEIIDFDLEAVAFAQWSEFVKAENPGLYSKIVAEESPHGVHVFYRCQQAIPGNTKLAIKTDRKVIIETRGTGGYCLVSPSKGYQLKQGSIEKLPCLSADERALLIDAARACNELLPTTIKGYAEMNDGTLLPGVDFDTRGDVRAILQKHGWTAKGTGQDGRERWQRPGKNGNNHSATLTDGKIFYPFSSNAAPFESQKSYGPFSTYTILEHGGDFSAAAAALAGLGYGTSQTERANTSAGGKATTGGPTMADLREYIDICVAPGQKITVDEICKGLSCFKRAERGTVYTYIGRLCTDGILKKDDYLRGGYRRVVNIEDFNLAGDINEVDLCFDANFPLELDSLLRIKPNQLLQVSGRYDSGKSSFMFHVMADNYKKHKIVHIISEEWSADAIKERMDLLGIPRPHPNIKSYPMVPGYEDLIPPGPCIVLVDYLRADENPYQTDAQIQRLLRNLDGGICIFATQKHPGLDKPVGGQFSVHACHHILMLDRWRDDFLCKIFRTKNTKNMEGFFRTFALTENKKLFPLMADWKRGEIKWERAQRQPKDDTANNANIANTANNFDVSKVGGPPKYLKKEKKEAKKRKKIISTPHETPSGDSSSFSEPHISKTNGNHLRGDAPPPTEKDMPANEFFKEEVLF
ncbi:hypothetical protein PITCH_A720015 [uncultured Desulfobacterium sp.]|uniref:DNA primase/polymerase bifunctional N-terminal domain-containing protein n=1 Tax=uncultured Desulfobacterium sp. TaxID=201089 RepID=A0A445N1U6_9BACT|nr:hypothetical protein PITCH_A720015 [uncultured Desulfobacterium sp.]